MSLCSSSENDGIPFLIFLTFKILKATQFIALFGHGVVVPPAYPMENFTLDLPKTHILNEFD